MATGLTFSAERAKMSEAGTKSSGKTAPPPDEKKVRTTPMTGSPDLTAPSSREAPLDPRRSASRDPVVDAVVHGCPAQTDAGGTSGLDYGDDIDRSTFEQILEMDDDDPSQDFSKSIVFSFFDQAETTFSKMERAL